MTGTRFLTGYGAVVLMSTAEDSFVLLHLNVGKLTHNQLARLWHFRLGHLSATVPYTLSKLMLTEDMECPMILNEECPC